METLRLATISDISTILSLYREAGNHGRKNGSSDWDDIYPNRSYAEYDIVTNGLYVYTIDNTIVAAFTLREKDDPDDFDLPWTPGKSCVLSRLCVLPSLQGKGMGTSMVRKAASVALNLDYEWFRLITPVINLASNAMYRRMGFREVGRYLFEDIDFVCYECQLEKI